MKANCIIVDDEPASRELLRRYISETERLNLLGECKHAMEANEFLKKERIDLMFLDINMPRISGIQFLRTLSTPPKVIFTTAYPQYAVEGFELDAVDYLLKPFSFERFLKALNKYTSTLETHINPEDRTILLKSNKKLYRISISDIVYLEATGDYVKVFYGTQMIMVHSTFSDLLEQVASPKLVRIHRSFALAIDKFDHIDGNQIVIKDNRLPIGKVYRRDLLARIDGK